MPPSDYGPALATAVAIPGLRARLRAYWSRLFNRGDDSVEGHRILD